MFNPVYLPDMMPIVSGPITGQIGFGELQTISVILLLTGLSATVLILAWKMFRDSRRPAVASRCEADHEDLDQAA